eukprot:2846353-Prymnesium_polylepis.2
MPAVGSGGGSTPDARTCICRSGSNPSVGVAGGGVYLRDEYEAIEAAVLTEDGRGELDVVCAHRTPHGRRVAREAVRLEARATADEPQQ